MTPAEMAAARAFRSVRRAELAKLETDITVSVFIRNDRHDCAARGGKSVALELKEHYAYSPAYDVNPGPQGDVAQQLPDGAEPGDWDVIIPAKRFGWIWTQGKCSSCGLTARSSTGRLADPEVRPPAEHAIIA